MNTTTPTALSSLDRTFRGQVVRPADPDYNSARAVWNGMIDKRPAVIARCTNAEDVRAAIRFARAQGLEIAIRGAGHNIAGTALSDGGLVIDLGPMNTVRVDPAARRAWVGPGATLGDIDRATAPHGLALPMGINSTTGISGLTLGGGFGWLTRLHGMTVDHLLSAEVATADGRLLRASEQEHADLFWALRGGGGNFGVVTEFEFQLRAVRPEVLTGLIVFPHADARAVLRRHREFVAAAPRGLNVWAVLRQAPPLPFLPPEVHGQDVVVLALVHAGDPDEGRALIEPLRSFGRVLGEFVGVQPFAAWQQAFDPLLTAGARNYWKSHNFAALGDEAIETVVDFAGRLPSPECEIFLGTLGGAAAQVPVDATAYANRDANFVMNVHARWQDPAGDAGCIAWARAFFDASAPFATGGVYVNFLTAEESGRVAAAYGPNYARLAAIKGRYDPENVFHVNQNIRPAR